MNAYSLFESYFWTRVSQESDCYYYYFYFYLYLTVIHSQVTWPSIRYSPVCNSLFAAFYSWMWTSYMDFWKFYLGTLVGRIVYRSRCPWLSLPHFEHTYAPWRDNAIRISWRSTVIHRSCCLASERPYNRVIVSLGSLVRFWYHTPFLRATILCDLSLTKQRALRITCHNMSIASPYYIYAPSSYISHSNPPLLHLKP